MRSRPKYGRHDRSTDLVAEYIKSLYRARRHRVSEFHPRSRSLVPNTEAKTAVAGSCPPPLARRCADACTYTHRRRTAVTTTKLYFLDAVNQVGHGVCFILRQTLPSPDPTFGLNTRRSLIERSASCILFRTPRVRMSTPPPFLRPAGVT